MLKPDLNRLDYGEQLVPPAGYELDAAIATTYSLDLNALLAVPIALFFGDTLDGDLKGEKLALMEAVSQLKDKVRVFYQKGNIKQPAEFNRLFTLLEPCLHPMVPKGGAHSSFHPKIWLMRFSESEPKTKKPKVCYRLLILSRNLTFDRSWDVALSLEGIVERAGNQNPENNTWVQFMKDLISQANDFASSAVLLKELPNIIWETPEKFNKLSLPVGGDVYGSPVTIPQTDCDEVMVVSPFISIEVLDWLASSSPSGSRYLFSRANELNAIGPVVRKNWQCYAINESIANSEERLEINDERNVMPQRQDLHAKIIIHRKGNKVWWQMGSANATNAALGSVEGAEPRNSEVMAKLVGTNSKVGPAILMDQWVNEPDTRFFIEHEPEEIVSDELHPLKKRIREIEHQLISAHWKQTCLQSSNGSGFNIDLAVNLPLDLNNGELKVTVEQLAAPGKKDLFENTQWLDVEQSRISAFILVQIELGKVDPLESNLVIETDLMIEGGDHRSSLIFKDMVDTPDKLLSYLSLLLQTSPSKAHWLSIDQVGTSHVNSSIWSNDHPIFEQLLIAASRHPGQLKRISETIKRVRKAGIDIPDEFMNLWKHFEKEIR